MSAPTVEVDGRRVPLDDCIWLQRRPCGCIVAAVVAVVEAEWTLATAEQANEHLNPTPWDRDRAKRAGLSTVPVSSLQYRERHRDGWHCPQHAPAA